MTARRRHASRRSRRYRLARGIGGLVLLGAIALGGVLGASGSPTVARPPTVCPQMFVPAFFPLGADWTAMAKAPSPPTTVILDLTSLGAGTAPEPGFASAVAALQARGVLVLGYSSTSYATRPIDQVVADARNYAAWYGVHNMFLDEVTSDAAHLGYYQALDKAIHAVEPKATIWLNPGTYPVRAYMGLGDVVMVFEGPWSTYASLRVPHWVYHYPATRFAYVVYDTPAGDLTGGIWLARHRRGGNLYLTDGTGGNPYGTLPSYFAAEDAQAGACATTGSG